MNDPSRNPIPKWWLQSIAVLVTGSPPCADTVVPRRAFATHISSFTTNTRASLRFPFANNFGGDRATHISTTVAQMGCTDGHMGK